MGLHEISNEKAGLPSESHVYTPRPCGGRGWRRCAASSSACVGGGHARLVCVCYPKRCHADGLAKLVRKQAAAERGSSKGASGR